MTDTADRTTSSRRGRSGRPRIEHGVPVRRALAVICVVAVALAAFGDARPVGVRWLDAVWSAGFVVAFIRSRERILGVLVGLVAL